MAPHSSTLAWKIPWTEEPGRLQTMGSLESDTTERLHFHFSLSCIGEGNGNPLQYSCLENPRDGGAWWAAVYGVAQSWIRLKWLSSSIIGSLWEMGINSVTSEISVKSLIFSKSSSLQLLDAEVFIFYSPLWQARLLGSSHITRRCPPTRCSDLPTFYRRWPMDLFLLI